MNDEHRIPRAHSATYSSAPYDLVLHGGRVFDPGTGQWHKQDVGLRSGRVANMAPHIPPHRAKRHVDVGGLLLSPGFVDLHVHSYWGATFWGVPADNVSPRGGVTTAVDAGSAGAFNFAGFQRSIVGVDRTRALAFINISGIGLVGASHELTHPGFADAARTVEVVERYGETVVGVKVRVAPDIVGEQFPSAMREARAAADALGKPLMVHIATQPPTLADILVWLQPGDIITHCFTARANKIVDGDLRLRDDVKRLLDAGVRLDVGHGSGSFSFPVAEAVLDQGLRRLSISSDLHSDSVNGPVYDFTNVMTKFLHLGVSLEDVLTMSTLRPAEAIGQADRLGRLYEGGPGDVAVFDVGDEAVVLRDSDGGERRAERRLRVHLTVTRGEVSYADERVHLVANPHLGGNVAVTGKPTVGDEMDDGP